MEIKNQIIEEFKYTLHYVDKTLHLSNSIVKKLNFDYSEVKKNVIIENCIVGEFIIHSCWFQEGLILSRNHFMSYINYRMGGHNNKSIELESNIFHQFVNFFDCQFKADLIVNNNVFLKGTNLLGNVDEGFKNIFESGIIMSGNVGRLDIDGV